MSTMAILKVLKNTDATGQEIKIGAIYGYTKESFPGDTFYNGFVLVTGFEPAKEKRVQPFIKCFEHNEGWISFNEQCHSDPRSVMETVMKDGKKLWPVSDEVVKTNPSCIKLKEYERSVQISEE